MQTVVGLTHSDQEAERAVLRLQAGGFAPASVGAANDLRSSWRTVLCRPVRLLIGHSTVGAVMGVALFAYLGVLLAAGGSVLGSGQGVAAGVVVLLMVAGGLAGGVLGLYVGLGDFAGQARLYLQGLRQGGALVVVHTADEHAPRAAAILQQSGMAQVRTCPAPRARPFLQRRLHPGGDRLSHWTRWAARGLGLALLVAVALIFVGQSAPGHDFSAPAAAVHLAGHTLPSVLLLGLAGVLVAWRWEGAGGLIIVASILLFQSAHALSSGYWQASMLDPLFYLTGLLFLWDWWRSAAADSPLSLPNP